MASESSAVANFVSLAQAQGIEESRHESASPTVNSRAGSLWLVLGIAIVACAIVGGYWLAVSESNSPATSVASESERELQLTEPTPTPTPVVATPLAPEDIELAKKTGFDVVVTPAGARVSLDGRAIGNAPLRVRNLLSGRHALEIEAVDGYFGRHFEFELSAGKAEVLTINLEPVDPEAVPVVVEPMEEVAEEPAVVETKPRPEPRSKKRRRSKHLAASDSLGTLLLGAKPPCQIIIDDKNTGLTTPQRSIQLPEGKHRVVLVNKEHGLRKSFTVNIKSRRKTRAIIDLSKQLKQ